MADRFLIYTHVCEELWDGHKDCQHSDPWEDKYDGRGAQFRKEYVDEIHVMAEERLPEIKEERRLKGDL
jgi:hypothetical protein